MTPNGWLISLAFLATAAAWSLLGYPDAGILALPLATLLLIGLVWRFMPLARYAVTLDAPTVSVHRGEMCAVSAAVTTTGVGLRPAVRLELEVRNSVVVHVVDPRSRQPVQVPVRAVQRGLWTLAPIRVSCGDPLGLMLRRRPVAGSTLTLRVLPKLIRFSEAAPAVPATDDDDGGALALDGRGVNFTSLREYVPGDDVRLIRWTMSSPDGTPFVRHNVPALVTEVVILLDQHIGSGRAAEENLETAVDIVYSLAHATLRGAGQVTVITTGEGRAWRSTTAEEVDDRVLSLTPCTTPHPPDSLGCLETAWDLVDGEPGRRTSAVANTVVVSSDPTRGPTLARRVSIARAPAARAAVFLVVPNTAVSNTVAADAGASWSGRTQIIVVDGLAAAAAAWANWAGR